MRFLVDECTGPSVARWLREQGHDVFSVFDQARGVDDDWIIQKAMNENRILVTNDKDFGEKVFRQHQTHKGIVLLRLDDERAVNKIKKLDSLLKRYPENLPNHFVVVTVDQIRLAAK